VGEFQRDPVSVQFDPAARRFLARAYANDGAWTGTYLARPDPSWRAWGLFHGFDLESRDQWGEVRWVRGFKRACYWNLANYGYTGGLQGDRRISKDARARALVWETGQLVLKSGWPGRRYAIRIKVVPGGQAAAAHVENHVPRAKRYTENAAARSDFESRDYAVL
jgi:hypothetical protein